MDAPVVDLSANHVVSPNTLYYMALYVLVIVVRFFKLKKDTTEIGTGRVFYVALELVYTASGLVVLLLADLKDYAPFIIVSYLIIVLISSQIESLQERFSPRTVLSTHLIILLAIVGITVAYFEIVQPKLARERIAKIELKKIAPQSTKADYKVAVPYADIPLTTHLGPKFAGKLFFSLQTVEANSEKEARLLGLDKARSTVRPFRTKNDGDEAGVIFDQDKIIVERVASKEG